MMNLTNKKKKYLSLKGLGALLAVTAALWVNGVQAQKPQPGIQAIVDPKAVGQASALRAGPSSVSGLYLNPATIAMEHVGHMAGMYQYTGGDKLHMGGIAIVDSITRETIAGGLALNYRGANLSRTQHKEWDAKIALAGNIREILFVGVTGKYLRVENDLKSGNTGPNGEAVFPSSGSLAVNGVTFDAGLGLSMGLISLGVVGYNLTNVGSLYAPLQLAPGIRAKLMDIWVLEVDTVIDFTSYDKVTSLIEFGTELLLAGQLGIRGGYMFDTYHTLNSIAVGLSYVHTTFALDVGYQHEVAKDSRYQLAFGIKIFVR